MKQTVKMSRATGQLEKMFNVLNADFFFGSLPTPIITVQSKPGTYGHCSRAKIWQRKDEQAYELNIAAEALNENIEEILDTLIHEMIHLYCRENGIKEVSRNGYYHNDKFRKLAEERLLICEKQGKYGWNTVAKDNDKLIEYALSKGFEEIKIGRGYAINYGGLQIPTTGITGTTTGIKAPSSTRKYLCPKCGNSVRATKDLNIICGDDMETMQKV